MRGTIALDIDGTIAANGLRIPLRTVEYLSTLAANGWRLIFITGRSFQSGYKALKDLPFPYYFAVQNGALILEMPSQRVIGKRYLDRAILKEMDMICKDEPSDYVIYAGYEHGDQCFYRPHRFSPPLRDYVRRRYETYQEQWQSLETYDHIGIDTFASVKCFGLLEQALALAEKIESALGLHVPVIRDPFSEEYYVIQATHPQNSKGQALKDLIAITGERGKVIAAGDDNNDLPMLAVADVKVAMKNAPKGLLAIADVIAPLAEEEGIIIGLEAALKHAGTHRI